MSSRKHQRFFENYYIPSYGIKEDIDLLHLPQNGFGLSSEGNFAKLVTIHDLIPYILPETVGKGYLKKFIQSMLKVHCYLYLAVEKTNHMRRMKFLRINTISCILLELRAKH